MAIARHCRSGGEGRSCLDLGLVEAVSAEDGLADATVYFHLWGSRDGIVNGVTGCSGTAHPLTNGHLAKTSGKPAVHLWDTTFSPPGYRHIVDRATFGTKYHFAPASIQTKSAVSPVLGAHPWA